MDIEELIQGTLTLAEKQEVEATHEPSLYTYKLNNGDNGNVFTDMVCYGEICVLASSFEVASLLFFLLEGYYKDDKWGWYTEMLQQWIIEYEHELESRSEEWDGDITCDVAYALWSKYSHGVITQHNLLAPIRIKHHEPLAHNSNDSGLDTYVEITPALSEIWTLTRLRRNLIG